MGELLDRMKKDSGKFKNLSQHTKNYSDEEWAKKMKEQKEVEKRVDAVFAKADRNGMVGSIDYIIPKE